MTDRDYDIEDILGEIAALDSSSCSSRGSSPSARKHSSHQHEPTVPAVTSETGTDVAALPEQIAPSGAMLQPGTSGPEGLEAHDEQHSMEMSARDSLPPLELDAGLDHAVCEGTEEVPEQESLCDATEDDEEDEECETDGGDEIVDLDEMQASDVDLGGKEVEEEEQA
eukprot:4039604-Amphidinium_carterae.1